MVLLMGGYTSGFSVKTFTSGDNNCCITILWLKIYPFSIKCSFGVGLSVGYLCLIMSSYSIKITLKIRLGRVYL